MKGKCRKSRSKILALLLASCVLLGYLSWLSLRPVEIISVHEDGNFSDVLVRNFPFTDKGKIKWWLKNKGLLQERFNIPNPAKDGFFSVVFWDFGEGYKEEGKYDRRCFNDMQSKVRCIDKKKVFSVWNGKGTNISFGVYDGEYRIKENGEMVKTKYK